ncbi:MAG: helix-turn-helix domain-containing protein [Planctomycetota bacterium]
MKAILSAISRGILPEAQSSVDRQIHSALTSTDGVTPQGVGVVSGTFEIPLVRMVGGNLPRQSGVAVRVSDLAYVGDDDNLLVKTVLNSLVEPKTSGDESSSNDARRDRQDSYGWTYNPLVICGASGTGKSLLANCYAGLWHTNSDSILPVHIQSGADWARDYAQAVNAELVPKWREECRECSMFVLDDVLLLRNRANAQRELVDLIDDLVESNIPLVVTNTIAPSACEYLHPRLASRLSSGLTLELNPPGVMARQQIVHRLARQQNQTLSSDAATWFAEKQFGTVPSIRNALSGCLARSTKSQSASVEITQTELRQLFESWQSDLGLPIKLITRVVARYCQTTQQDMLGLSRKKPVVQARSMAMYLARKFSGASLREIGRHFGDRDHTTVLHACTKIESDLANEPTMRVAIDELQRILSNERHEH